MRRPDLLRAVALGLGLSAAAFVGCSGWDPRSPFEHNAPEVDEALQKLDGGHAASAEETLERYLGTGACSADAGLGLPPSIRQKPSGTFDLGLTLFDLGEHFGQRFGDEDRSDGGSPAEQALSEKRALEVGCALLVVRAIAADPTVPIDLRARAYYLAGNLEFLLQKYEDAVKEYDQALALIPGIHAEAGGDGIGRDAAWNRAIALRRQEDQKDAGNDAPDASPDANDAGNDAADGSDGNDGSSGNDGGDKGDAGKDGGDKEDAGKDGGDKQDGGQDGGDNEDGGGTPPPPQPASSQSATPQQDSRMLEQLEQAPSYQGQEAKQRANANARRGRPTMEDK
jgi:tetratricopeptide (TPR) repeat protein